MKFACGAAYASPRSVGVGIFCSIRPALRSFLQSFATGSIWFFDGGNFSVVLVKVLPQFFATHSSPDRIENNRVPFVAQFPSYSIISRFCTYCRLYTLFLVVASFPTLLHCFLVRFEKLNKTILFRV